MMLSIRRTSVIISEQHVAGRNDSAGMLRKVAIVSILENPYAGRFVEDLSPLIDASASLGSTMAQRAVDVFGSESIQSYGKGGIVGLAGEQEHANALLTTTFANQFREVIGGGDAWISSVTKVGQPGSLIDIPMNHKDEVYVRSHYDTMSIVLPDSPLPDEIAIIFCLANRGRLNARVGGLTHEEVVARRATKG